MEHSECTTKNQDSIKKDYIILIQFES